MMIENNLKPDLIKKTLTVQERRTHVRAYQASGESMIVYCDKHHLALSTFKTWVTKYGEKIIPAAFVPMTVTSHKVAEGIKKSLQHVEIHMGELKIVVSEATDIEMLIQLIRGLSHANPAKSAGNLVL